MWYCACYVAASLLTQSAFFFSLSLSLSLSRWVWVWHQSTFCSLLRWYDDDEDVSLSRETPRQRRRFILRQSEREIIAQRNQMDDGNWLNKVVESPSCRHLLIHILPDGWMDESQLPKSTFFFLGSSSRRWRNMNGIGNDDDDPPHSHIRTYISSWYIWKWTSELKYKRRNKRLRRSRWEKTKNHFTLPFF